MAVNSHELTIIHHHGSIAKLAHGFDSYINADFLALDRLGSTKHRVSREKGAFHITLATEGKKKQVEWEGEKKSNKNK